LALSSALLPHQGLVSALGCAQCVIVGGKGGLLGAQFGRGKFFKAWSVNTHRVADFPDLLKPIGQPGDDGLSLGNLTLPLCASGREGKQSRLFRLNLIQARFLAGDQVFKCVLNPFNLLLFRLHLSDQGGAVS
jgi:hypothetical protein